MTESLITSSSRKLITSLKVLRSKPEQLRVSLATTGLVQIILLASMYFFPVGALAQTNFTVIDLDTVDPLSFGLRINASGQVLGQKRAAGTSVFTPVVWEKDPTLPPPGYKAIDVDTNATAFDINDVGVVVGRSPASGLVRATLWKKVNNVYQKFDLGLGDGSQARGINNAGQVVGVIKVIVPPTVQFHAVLLEPDATQPTGYKMTDLGLSNGEQDVRINNLGEIVWNWTDGIHVRTNGATVNLGLGNAIDINDSGSVVGTSGLNAATIWGKDSTQASGYKMTQLPALHTDDIATKANGINNTGQVVGSYTIFDGGAHPALWQKVNGVYQIQSLETFFTGSAQDINDTPEIIGTSSNTNGFYAALWRQGCIVAVTRLGQCGPDPATNNPQSLAPWGTQTPTNEYAFHSLIDPKGYSICRWGCYTTSLSMALNSEKVGLIPSCSVDPITGEAGSCVLGPIVPNDPGSLNRFMKDFQLYSNNAVDPTSTTAWLSSILNKGNLTFFPRRIDSAASANALSTATKYLDDTLCAGHAVIVGVRSCVINGKVSFPCHFLLVYGKQGDNYLIADPAAKSINPLDTSPRETLLLNGVYGTHFVTRGYVKDPTGDRGILVLNAGTVADVFLTDPLGRRTGLDTSTNLELDDIPNSAHFIDAVAEEESDTPSDLNHAVHVIQPITGTYTVTINGVGTGLYTLQIRSFSTDGTAKPSVSVPGIAGEGSTSTVNIQFDTTPGAVPQATLVATFSSTLADIANASALGLISPGVASALTEKIQDAFNALSTGDKKKSKNILSAFLNQLATATRNKQIDPTVAKILTEDANSLAAQMT